jgi:hypothetical protein
MPERVINPSDRTQRLVIYWIYALTFGHGQRWLESAPFVSTLVGGWQLQGVFTRQSGPPLGFGDALLQPGETLANVALSASQRTVTHCFNTRGICHRLQPTMVRQSADAQQPIFRPTRRWHSPG